MISGSSFVSDDDQKYYFCVGFLISEIFVVTTAHCVDGSNALDSLKLTAIHLGNKDHIQKIAIDNVIIHSTYNKTPPFYNDIALIRLQAPAEIDNFVRPICLPTLKELTGKFEVNGTQLKTISGDFTDDLSNLNPKATFLSLVPDEQCSQTYFNEKDLDINVNQLCAIGQKDDDGTCKGNFGGPLMLCRRDAQGKIYSFLIGLLSFGPSKCDEGHMPLVYTRILSYIEWIESKTIEK